MSSGILQVVQRELTCPICMNYSKDPVRMDCGHSFCRSCFYLNWQDIPLLVQCSECRKSTQQRNLKTNIHLKKMASLARKASLWLFLSSEEQMCGTHRETKKMFCDVDKSLLCLLCSSSQEHRDHRHRPIEWAAEEHRVSDKSGEKHRFDYVNLRLEAIRAEYQKMPAFHHEEEKHNLEMLKKKGKDIFHQRHLGMYEELKEMCHKPYMKLLQVFPCTSESVLLHKPQPLNLELSSGPIAGLMDRLNQFQVHTTLHHEDMYVGCDHQDVPYITATPRSFLAWGAQTITSGKYYWEFHVGDSWNWAFGKNQNEKIDGEEGLFLLGCVKNDIQCHLFTTSPLMLQYIPRPNSLVGLFLDYEAKTVSFVDVNQSSLICTIPNCSFSPPLRPIFCCIHF
uniref:Tripartite motif-containing protein 5 n=1 Tax=Rhinopithecus roxellana TaxID=61622 RepID=A0A2K6PQC7_RHIRO